MPVNTELVARLLQPIRSDAPAGNDLRYDARVDAIKEARREDLDLPTNNAEVKRKLADWPFVITQTTELLEKETKDLQLSVWLAEALLHKEGYGGLATGLSVVQGLLDQFWETVYPLPEDEDDVEARVGPLLWIADKLMIPLRMVPYGRSTVSFLQIETSREVPSEADADADSAKSDQRAAAVEQGKPTPEIVESALAPLNKIAVRGVVADLDAVRAAIASLGKSADERFGRDAPAFGSLRSTLDEIGRYTTLLLKNRLETDPDPEIAETGEEGGAAIGEDGTEALSVEPTSRADASQRLGVVARWFRAQDSTNPAPYLLVRGFRWGELRTAAPDIDPKLLEAPPTATRARLKTLLLDGKWTELLEQSEGLMATAPGRGWLDLQRYVLTACAALGGSHDGVASAIRSELHALLSALPALTRMTLMDDTPTANEETRAWLASEGLLNGQPPAVAPETSAAGDDAEAPASDPAVVLAEALEDDASSARQGGFARGRPVRRPVRGRDPFESACSELAAGRPNRAIEVLMAELAREQSARGRLVRQTQIAYVMVEAGLDAVAQPILQRIVETIDERKLEEWESGPLVAQPMALLCRVLDRTGGDETQRHELYLRVCRLDPLQAIALQAK